MIGAEEALGIRLVDVLGARGSRGEPAVLRHHLETADRRAVAGRRGQDRRDRLAGQLARPDLLRRQLRQRCLLGRRGGDVDAPVDRVAVALRQPSVDLAGVAPAAGRHLGRQQAQDQAVLVGRPGRAIAAQERRARALLAAEPERAVEQPVDEPLEAHRHLDEPAPEAGDDAIDDAAADQRLAHPGVAGPVARAAEQVRDAGGQVVVGVQQAGARRDDAVPVRVRIVGERDVEAVLEVGQPRHRVGRRAVHADLAVPVDGHEREGRVDRIVDDRQVDVVALGDRGPVGDARAAQRVDAQPQPTRANGVQVDDRGQLVDVGGDVVASQRALHGLLVGDPLDALEAGVEQLVGLALDPGGHLGAGRAAVGRVVLEAAVLGRVVRRRDDDPVGGALAPAAVVREDRVRDDGRRRVAVVGVDRDRHVVGGQHLEDAARRRLGQPMRVTAEEERTVDALRAAVPADGLADREHVGLVERVRRRAPAVARRPERDALLGHRRVGRSVVVRGDQLVGVDQAGGVRRLPGEWADAHS